MKKILLATALLLIMTVQAFPQARVYSTLDTISGATDTTYIKLNGLYGNVTMVIADTTGTPTLNAKVNYGTDSTAWYNAYVFTNYGTSAANLSLAPSEGTIYIFADQAIRWLKLYITGGTLRYELKANMP